MPRHRHSSKRVRRWRKVLSGRSVHKHTSAHHQADQILALNRRVSRVQRQLRPDLKVVTFENPSRTTFTNSSLASTYNSSWYLQRMLGVADDQRIADKIRLRTFQFYGSFEYANNFAASTATTEARGGYVRILILQAKTTDQYLTAIDEPQNIISHYSNSGSAYDLNCIAPLAKNITQQWAVLRDMHFRLSEDNPVKQLKFRVAPRWRTIRYGAAGPQITYNSEYPDHGIMVFICVSGLHWQTDVNEQIECSQGCKFVYTDM